MASGLENGGRAGVSALVLLSLGGCVAAALVVAKASGGRRPATAEGRGSGPVRVASNRLRGLYPGAGRTLIMTLRNSDRKHRVLVRRVRVRDAATTKRGCAPSRRNLSIRQPTFGAFLLRPGESRRVAARLGMPSTVADACQGAVFHLRYRVVVGGTR